MDPYEVIRERHLGPINDTDFNITITNYYIKTLNAFFNMYNHA